MSQFHKIRLHGPWQADFFSPSLDAQHHQSSTSHQRRVKLPTDDLIDWKISAGQQIVLARHFNWPHATTDQILLQVVSNGRWKIQLNGQPVTDQEPTAITTDAPLVSIQHLLQTRNLLRMETETLASECPPKLNITEVSLNISR